jgi:hypothetical protein
MERNEEVMFESQVTFCKFDSQTCRDAIERYCLVELYCLIKRAKELKRLYKEEKAYPSSRSEYQRRMYRHKIIIRILFLCLAYVRRYLYSSVEKKIYIQYPYQRQFMMKRICDDMVNVIYRALSTVVLEDGEIIKIGGSVKSWLGE